MWQNLAINLAEISAAILVWQLFSDRFDTLSGKRGRFITGLVFGLAGCFSMALAKPLMPGFIFDLRSPMVACAAFFGGPIGAIPAVLLTGGYRVHIGGSGAAAGLLSLSSAATGALVLRALWGDRSHSAARLAVLAGIVTMGVCLGYTLIPRESIVQVVRATIVPMICLTFVATWLIALLCNREVYRRDLIRTNTIYRQMVRFLPDSLNAKDIEGRFIAVNPATARLHGLDDPDDLLGKTDADYYDEARATDFAEVEKTAIATGETQTIEQEIVINGGEVSWVATQKVPILDVDDKVIGVITHNRDITHHRQLLKMKNEFVSMVSHELRTPLTSVRGSLGLLMNMLGDETPTGARNLLGIAHRNSERLVHLINDILDMEKIEDGGMDFNMSRRELAPLIREALPSYANFMPEQKVTVRFLDEAEGAMAVIDPTRFEQVLSNLISNAIKFSDGGGTVTIRLIRQDGRVIVSVADRGQGIPEFFKARIFTRFEQVDTSDSRQKGGTGLGLHIAKVFIEKMGGMVRFVSNPGQGTTFFVDLPEEAASGDRADITAFAREASETRGASKRVLYVEDDVCLGQFVAESLQPDVKVDHVTTLNAGRIAVRSMDYDMLIIDDLLPDGSGLSLISETGSDVPAIVFTAQEISGPLPSNVYGRFVKTRMKEAEVVEKIRVALWQGPGALSKSA